MISREGAPKPAIRIAPAGVRDSFFQTLWAFHLAEKYQVPVLLATDHSLSNRTENIHIPNIKDIPLAQRKLATEADLTRWARDTMAAYKVPASFEFVESLPKSATGKILWRVLQEQQDERERTAT